MAKIKFMALGGLGENGKNMYVVEVEQHLFILDAGMKTPDIDLYGIDSVIPDISYLIDHKDSIEGIFLSHGHIDNIGACCYLLKNLQTRVYGSHFTISVLEEMLNENNMNKEDYKLFRINANKIMKFGDVDVEFFNTTHSIPESMGIAIMTKDGAIVYATDFEFAIDSSLLYRTTFDKICDLGKGKVLALLSESISSATTDRPSNDTIFETKFGQLLEDNHTRIICGMYSNELSRIQKVVNLANEHHKRIAIIGKKHQRILKVGVESGYLHLPEDLLHLSQLTKEEIEKLENVIILVCGYHLETYNQLIRMVETDDELIKIKDTDDVVLACPPVPGMEKGATDTINLLSYHNVNLHVLDRTVLKSTHATPDDLRLLYSILKPEYIIPIKGEYRHIYAAKEVALNFGYQDDKVLFLENGEQVIFDDGVKEEENIKYSVKDIYVDGSFVGKVNDEVVADRTTLCEEGVIFIYGVLDIRQRKLKNPIRLASKGFTSNIDDEGLNNSFSDVLTRICNNSLNKGSYSKEHLNETLVEELSKNIFRFTKHRPVIMPLLIETK